MFNKHYSQQSFIVNIIVFRSLKVEKSLDISSQTAPVTTNQNVPTTSSGESIDQSSLAKGNAEQDKPTAASVVSTASPSPNPPDKSTQEAKNATETVFLG